MCLFSLADLKVIKSKWASFTDTILCSILYAYMEVPNNKNTCFVILKEISGIKNTFKEANCINQVSEVESKPTFQTVRSGQRDFVLSLPKGQ